MSRTAPFLSLVVLSFQRFDTTTGPCLRTLDDSPSHSRVELILVDNGSDDGATERCAEQAKRDPRITFLPQMKNLGFAGGMNAGVAAAHGEWVCLVNSDTLFPSGALESLLATLDAVPAKVAMVGPVTNAAGNGQRLPLPDVPINHIARIGEAAMRSPTDLITPTYRSDFFCVAVRRSVWQQLNGLDPVFGLGYYEDFDFSLRLAEAGFHQVIAEDVFIAHVGSATFSGMGRAQHELMRNNRKLIAARHPGIRFEHVRVGNAQALRYLIEAAHASGWTEGLRQRAAWRFAALLWDEPRSPFKRWRWRWHTRDIRRSLIAAAIDPRFPAPFATL